MGLTLSLLGQIFKACRRWTGPVSVLNLSTASEDGISLICGFFFKYARSVAYPIEGFEFFFQIMCLVFLFGTFWGKYLDMKTDLRLSITKR